MKSLILILFLGFVVYAHALNSQFIWDDDFWVTENTYIRDFSHIGDFFKGHTSSLDPEKGSGFYRPIHVASYTIDYSLWGLDPKGYHLTNIVLHILAALSLYLLVNSLFADRFLSCLTALFFVIHPVHTEAVSFISGRSDPLSAIFMFLSFYFYIKAQAGSKKISYILSILTFAGALLSRESGLILPFLILLYHYAFRKKIYVAGFLPFPVMFSTYILLRGMFLKTSLGMEGFFQRLPGAFAAIASYIKLLIFPFHLHMEYGNRLFGFADIAVISGIIVSVIFLICTFMVRSTSRLVFFGISWFFIAMMPHLNLYPIGAYMREHWLYVPSAGAFLILSAGLARLYRDKRSHPLAFVLILALTGFYSFLTIRQQAYWRDPLTFCVRTLKYSPGNPKMLRELSYIHKKQTP